MVPALLSPAGYYQILDNPEERFPRPRLIRELKELAAAGGELIFARRGTPSRCLGRPTGNDRPGVPSLLADDTPGLFRRAFAAQKAYFGVFFGGLFAEERKRTIFSNISRMKQNQRKFPDENQRKMT